MLGLGFRGSLGRVSGSQGSRRSGICRCDPLTMALLRAFGIGGPTVNLYGVRTGRAWFRV